MGILYAENGKIMCKEYMEVYIPLDYFEDKYAINIGNAIQSIGIVYMREFPKGEASEFKLIDIPVVVQFMVHDFSYETIHIHGKSIDVMTLKYIPNSYVLHQSVTKGREVAEAFLSSMLGGKIPRTLKYDDILDMWWKNLEISGVNFNVPSKIYEIIIATIYRSPNNPKQRYGQYYAKNANATGYDYRTGNVRAVVRDLSTFSGMVFEDIGTMITNGISNSIDGKEEPISPLEKIIHY